MPDEEKVMNTLQLIGPIAWVEVPLIAVGRLTEWLLRAFALLLIIFVVARCGHAWWIDQTR